MPDFRLKFCTMYRTRSNPVTKAALCCKEEYFVCTRRVPDLWTATSNARDIRTSGKSTKFWSILEWRTFRIEHFAILQTMFIYYTHKQNTNCPTRLDVHHTRIHNTLMQLRSGDRKKNSPKFNCQAMPLGFHIIPAITEAFITLWDELFCSMSIPVHAMCYQPCCNYCFHLPIIFKSVVVKILLQWS